MTKNEIFQQVLNDLAMEINGAYSSVSCSLDLSSLEVLYLTPTYLENEYIMHSKLFPSNPRKKVLVL